MKNKFFIATILTLSFFSVSCSSSSEPSNSSANISQTDNLTQQNSPALPIEVPQTLPIVQATLKGHDLDIMLAKTFEEKRKGLMYRDKIKHNEGMLFVYTYPQRLAFWMKNTKIPLDIIFFSEKLTIVEMKANMQPGYGMPDHMLDQYTSANLAKYALELNAGSIESFALEIGDKLQIPEIFLPQ